MVCENFTKLSVFHVCALLVVFTLYFHKTFSFKANKQEERGAEGLLLASLTLPISLRLPSPGASLELGQRPVLLLGPQHPFPGSPRPPTPCPHLGSPEDQQPPQRAVVHGDQRPGVHGLRVQHDGPGAVDSAQDPQGLQGFKET